MLLISYREAELYNHIAIQMKMFIPVAMAMTIEMFKRSKKFLAL